MPRDVDISVGADTSAVTAGLATLRNQVRSSMNDISRDLGSIVAGGGIIAFFDKVIEKAHEIHHESERFGVDAQSLQLIGNAAKELGIPLEGVARGLNKMLIGGEAALANQNALRIDMEKFHAADPAGKFLLIADAVKEAGLSTETYDAVAKVFGARFGTELIPLLIEGSKRIKEVGEAGGIMSNETTAGLDRVHQVWETVTNQITVSAGPAILVILKALGAGVVTLTTNFEVLGRTAVGAFEAMEQARGGHLINAAGILAKTALENSDAIDDWKRRMGQVTGSGEQGTGSPFQAPAPTAGVGFDGTTGGVGGGAGSGTGSSGSSSSGEALQDRLAAKQRQYDIDQLKDQEKLQYLETERQEIQDKIDRGNENQTLSLEEEAGLNIKLLENDEARKKIQDQILDAQKKLNSEITQTRKDAEAVALDEERKLTILKLEAAGHGEVVAQLQVQWALQDKIDGLTNQLNNAWYELNRAYESGDQSLIDQAEQTVKILQNTIKTAKTEEEISAEDRDRLQAAADAKWRADNAGLIGATGDGLEAGGQGRYSFGELAQILGRGDAADIAQRELIGALTGSDTLGFALRGQLSNAFAQAPGNQGWYASQLAMQVVQQQIALLRSIDGRLTNPPGQITPPG